MDLHLVINTNFKHQGIFEKYFLVFFRDFEDYLLGDLILGKNQPNFFKKRDRDQIVDPNFRQGSRSNRFLK